MKAKELIEKLQKIVERHGDIDVYYDYDGGYEIIPVEEIDSYSGRCFRRFKIALDARIIVLE